MAMFVKTWLFSRRDMEEEDKIEMLVQRHGEENAQRMRTRMVSVVKDLTMRQRAGERELYNEAAKKNLTSSQE